MKSTRDTRQSTSAKSIRKLEALTPKRFIYLPAIDAIATVIEATLLRTKPLIIGFSAGIIALIGSILIDTSFGYAGNGLYMAALGFICGWIIGLIVELITAMVSGKHPSN